ncbi:hypothetical protein ACS0TY_018573 [Phlomoides rotata]
MDDDVELEVLLVTLFGLIAQMFMEVNTFVVLMSYGFLKFCRQSWLRNGLGRTYSLRTEVDDIIEDGNDVVARMDGNTETTRGRRGRKRAGATTHRVWTFAEVCELMNALKELVSRGNKCDNGFRSGYLLLLENMLALKFPGNDLKSEPHINSKIHVWKRHYVCLKNMLALSGVGLNSTTYHVEALPEVWDAQIKVDALTKSLRNKAFPFYTAWCEVFGNDTATGKDSQLYDDDVDEINKGGSKQTRWAMDVDDVNESTPMGDNNQADKTSFSVEEDNSATKEKTNTTKRSKSVISELQFMETVGNFCDTSKSTFGKIAETMGNIANRVGNEFDNRLRRDQAYDSLSKMDFMSVEARVAISQYLCNNTKDMDLFFSLPGEVKTVFVTNIMMNLSNC